MLLYWFCRKKTHKPLIIANFDLTFGKKQKKSWFPQFNWMISWIFNDSSDCLFYTYRMMLKFYGFFVWKSVVKRIWLNTFKGIFIIFVMRIVVFFMDECILRIKKSINVTYRSNKLLFQNISTFFLQLWVMRKILEENFHVKFVIFTYRRLFGLLRVERSKYIFNYW